MGIEFYGIELIGDEGVPNVAGVGGSDEAVMVAELPEATRAAMRAMLGEMRAMWERDPLAFEIVSRRVVEAQDDYYEAVRAVKG